MGNKGKRMVHMQRDERIYTSLYLTWALTLEQIARLYFPSSAYLENPRTEEPRYSVGSAWSRLRILRNNNCLWRTSFEPANGQSAFSYWRLPPNLFYREATAAGRPHESYPRFPKRMAHHLEVTDLYVDIHPHLEEAFEDGPGWEWRNESHAFVRAEYGGEPLVHQPDAEVRFPDGRVYFLERQTKESRKTEAVFREKARQYRRYISYADLSPEQATVVFACDEPRDMQYADRAVVDSRLNSLVTDPEDAAAFIVEQARVDG